MISHISILYLCLSVILLLVVSLFEVVLIEPSCKVVFVETVVFIVVREATVETVFVVTAEAVVIVDVE